MGLGSFDKSGIPRQEGEGADLVPRCFLWLGLCISVEATPIFPCTEATTNHPRNQNDMILKGNHYLLNMSTARTGALHELPMSHLGCMSVYTDWLPDSLSQSRRPASTLSSPQALGVRGL